jgi:hypothetical protein
MSPSAQYPYISHAGLTESLEGSAAHSAETDTADPPDGLDEPDAVAVGETLAGRPPPVGPQPASALAASSVAPAARARPVKPGVAYRRQLRIIAYPP